MHHKLSISFAVQGMYRIAFLIVYLPGGGGETE